MNKYMITGTGLMALFGYGAPVWAQQTDTLCTRSMMWGSGWHGGFLGPIMMILFLAITVAVIVLVVRWLGGSLHGNSGSPSAPARKHATDILKDRFARGEIDKEEFEEKRRILED